MTDLTDQREFAKKLYDTDGDGIDAMARDMLKAAFNMVTKVGDKDEKST